MNSYVVGVTGASAVVIARRLVGLLLDGGHTVHLCPSKPAHLIAQEELALGPGAPGFFGFEHALLHEWGEDDFEAPPASGSARCDGMVVVPCSMATVGSIAGGIADSLLRRSADVMLKERRPLILVPRETPLSMIHLENLTRVARAGAVVLPPMLTFYQQPGDGVAAQIDFVVSRILDHLGIDNQLYRRWGTGNA